MKIRTREECSQYCEQLENGARYGARFWRLGMGIESPEDARSVSATDLDSYLRVQFREFSLALLERASVSAMDTRKDLARHIGNAFPTLKGVGIVIRKSKIAIPTKAYGDCDADHRVTVTQDYENLGVWSVCWAWKHAQHADIADPTIVSPLAIGEKAENGHLPDMPRSVGFTPREVQSYGYTPEVVSRLLHKTVAEQWQQLQAVHNKVRSDLIDLTLSLVPGYDGPGPSLSSMYPELVQTSASILSATVSRIRSNRQKAGIPA